MTNNVITTKTNPSNYEIATKLFHKQKTNTIFTPAKSRYDGHISETVQMKIDKIFSNHNSDNI